MNSLASYGTALAVTALVSGLAAQSTCLSTVFSGTSTTTVGCAALFDVTVTNAIEIQSFEAHFAGASLGLPVGLEMWIVPTTWVGNESNLALWTRAGVDDGTAISAGGGQRTTVNLLAPVTLLPGSYGVSLIAVGASHRYANLGGSSTYGDSNLSLTLGGIDSTPWTGADFQPRIWNGSFCYTVPSGLIPGFVADRTTAGPGGTVTFTNTSFTSDPLGFLVEDWDFDGDGQVDRTGTTVSWTYPAGSTACGPQDVTLILADSTSGVVNFTQTGFVTLGAPVSSFSAVPSSGAGPLAVNFFDTSSNDPTGWSWDFDGDGIVDSTQRNPSNVFPTGVHDVSLTTFNACGAGSVANETIVATSSTANYVTGLTESFGSGCGPVIGVGLTLRASATPQDGSPFSLDASNVPNNAAAGAILFGLAPVDVPLDILGATACSLYTTPFATFGMALTPPTGTVSLTPAAGTSTIGARFHAQAAVIAIGSNPLGVVLSDRLSLEIGSDLSGIVDPSTLPGIVVRFEGTNTSNPPAPFFNVYNNSTRGEVVTRVVFDLFRGGPQVGGLTSVFDISGLSNGFEFDAGNAQQFDPTCPPNTYGGTDVTTGLVYAGTDPSACDPLMLGATTGWIGSNFSGPDPATVRFQFASFTPGSVFQFDVDVDGGPLGANGLHECVVIVETNLGAYRAMLVNLDNDTSFQVFGN